MLTAETGEWLSGFGKSVNHPRQRTWLEAQRRIQEPCRLSSWSIAELANFRLQVAARVELVLAVDGWN
jgi:hypothetical protein